MPNLVEQFSSLAVAEHCHPRPGPGPGPGISTIRRPQSGPTLSGFYEALHAEFSSCLSVGTVLSVHLPLPTFPPLGRAVAA
jgi:hypothetical protein